METEAIVEKFSTVAEQAQTLTFITRDRELQEEARTALDQFLEFLAAEKRARVKMGKEDEANLILGLGFACKALHAELSMYLALKGDRPEEAWNHLVSSQELHSAAMRAHPSLDHIKNNLQKLLTIERLVFPPQAFVSAGSIVRTEECSICQADYRNCNHIIGRPYMGEMCAVVCKDVELREVSFVDEPADKRCRVLFFTDQGKRRNKMTWRLE